MMTLSDRSQTQWRQRRVSLGAMRTNKHYSDWQLALRFFSLKDVKEQQGRCGIQIYMWDQTEENILCWPKTFLLERENNIFPSTTGWKPMLTTGKWGTVSGGVWDGIWSSRYNVPSWIRRRLDHFKCGLQSDQYVSIYQRFNMKHNVKVVRRLWNATLSAEENHCCGHCHCWR